MLLSSFLLVVSILAQHRALLIRGDQLNPDWTLLYSEDFSTPLNDAATAWSLDDYSEPFDTIMDDAGLYWANDYGPDGIAALNSFSTYRKEFPVGQDGWLTASLSARDWNKNGVIEDPPTLTTKQLPDGSFVAEMTVPDHTGGVIFRNSRPLPSEYRIEYKLKTIDFGGKRGGEIEYDNRINGYSTESPEADNCKTQHPWGEASRSGIWSGDASIPYCEWNGVREGPVAYNGFHFLSIVDVDNPAPRNNQYVLVCSLFANQARPKPLTKGSRPPPVLVSGTFAAKCKSKCSRNIQTELATKVEVESAIATQKSTMTSRKVASTWSICG